LVVFDAVPASIAESLAHVREVVDSLFEHFGVVQVTVFLCEGTQVVHDARQMFLDVVLLGTRDGTQLCFVVVVVVVEHGHVVFELLDDSHAQRSDELVVRALLVHAELHDLDHLLHQRVNVVDVHYRAVHAYRAQGVQGVNLVVLPHVVVLECCQAVVQELGDLLVGKVVVQKVDYVRREQKGSFDYFLVLGVEADRDYVVELAQVGLDLVGIAVVGDHEQREGRVGREQQPVGDQLDGGLEVRLGLFSALVLESFRQLVHDDQNTVEDRGPLVDVHDDGVVLEHFDAAVVQGAGLVEAFLRRVLHDRADGGTQVAYDLELVLRLRVRVHLHDAVAYVFEVVARLEPLVPILFEVVFDGVGCLLTQSDEQRLYGVQRLARHSRVGLQGDDQSFDQRLDVIQEGLRRVFAHSGQRPAARELQVGVSAADQELDDELGRVADQREERVVARAVRQGTDHDDCAPHLHDLVGIDVPGHELLQSVHHGVFDVHRTQTDAGGAGHVQVPLDQVQVGGLLEVFDQNTHEVALDLVDDVVVGFALGGERLLFLDHRAPEFDAQGQDFLVDACRVELGESDHPDFVHLLVQELLVVADEVDEQHECLLAHFDVVAFAEADDVVDDEVALVVVLQRLLEEVVGVEDGFERDDDDLCVVVVQRAGEDRDQFLPDFRRQDLDNVPDFDQLLANVPSRLDARQSH